MIDISKKYRTRDGRKVRIYATDGGGEAPIHGAIWSPDREKWFAWVWHEDGRLICGEENKSDIIEVKPRIQQTVWLNIYAQDVCSDVFNSKENADLWASECRVACVKVEIDCEEGEGL